MFKVVVVPGHGGAHHAQALEPEIKEKVADQVSALKTAVSTHRSRSTRSR